LAEGPEIDCGVISPEIIHRAGRNGDAGAQIFVGVPSEVNELQAEPPRAVDALQDAHPLGDHFRPDAVSRDDGDFFAHGGAIIARDLRGAPHPALRATLSPLTRGEGSRQLPTALSGECRARGALRAPADRRAPGSRFPNRISNEHSCSRRCPGASRAPWFRLRAPEAAPPAPPSSALPRLPRWSCCPVSKGNSASPSALGALGRRHRE